MGLQKRGWGGIFFFLRKFPRFLKDVLRMFTRSIAIGFANARGSRNTGPDAIGF
jgi:hypothetical protein